MSRILFDDGHHRVLAYHDVNHAGEAVQANQFLILDGEQAATLDPGGNLGFNELLLEMGRATNTRKLQYLIASHADPDIIGALDRWMSNTDAMLLIPEIWARFAPHFTRSGRTEGRVVGVPDAGAVLPFGRSQPFLLPAHFMHSEGNIQVYDPVSRILFSGDLGVSIVSGPEADTTVTELGPHLHRMEAFHRRYMVSRKVLALWANMVRPLDIRMIVPQHGAPLGGAAVRQFIDWISTLECGVDLVSERNYAVPTRLLGLEATRSVPAQ